MALDDIHVKLDRAKEHLNTLNSEIDRFATKKPYAFHVITEYGSNRSYDVEWLREPPLRWSAIVGDCVHNLRSALDHIVWALSGGDGNAPNHAEFSIFIDEEKYLKRTKEGEPARGSGLWKIQAVSAFKGKAVFYRLQPFNGTDDPTRHPLWILKNSIASISIGVCTLSAVQPLSTCDSGASRPWRTCRSAGVRSMPRQARNTPQKYSPVTRPR